MLTKSQARTFFIGSTGLFTAGFLTLVLDTHRQVPAQTHVDKITPAVARGKRIWEHNNCMGCQTLLDEGACHAPELTKVVERRGPEFLRVFLKDPQATFPGQRKMVNCNFTDAQIDDAIAFLDWCGKVDFNGFPLKPPLQQTAVPVAAQQLAMASTNTVPAIFLETRLSFSPLTDARVAMTAAREVMASTTSKRPSKPGISTETWLTLSPSSGGLLNIISACSPRSISASIHTPESSPARFAGCLPACA